MTNQILYPYPIQKITIHDKVEMAYMDTGKGKQTLLFIHGLANYAPVWKHQLDELKNEYRCIAIDLPGNGYSTRGDYPYSQFFYAECVKQFVDATGLENPVLVGHSMGGQISLMLSLRYPSIFQQLILIGPAGIEIFSSTDIMFMQNILSLGDFFYADEMHLESTIRDGFANPGIESNQIISDLKKIMKGHSTKLWRQMAISSINGMLNEQINQFLHLVTAKTLLLFGSKDSMIPNRMLHPMETTEKIATQGAALIQDCEMHLIQGAGHFAFIEKHAETNQLIRDWLKK